MCQVDKKQNKMKNHNLIRTSCLLVKTPRFYVIFVTTIASEFIQLPVCSHIWAGSFDNVASGHLSLSSVCLLAGLFVYSYFLTVTM